MMLFRDPGDELLAALREIDPDRLAPLDALKKLADWKARFDSPPSL